MRITEPISVTVLLIAVLVPHSAGLSQTQKRSSVRTLDALAEGVDMGSDTVKVFEDDTHSPTFRLFTSWIHGEKHQGYIRYRMSATGVGLSLKEAPAYVERLHKCDLTAILYDSGKFILRRVPLVFMREVADSGDVVEITANDLSQMDRENYQRFISKGSWQISWVCPT